MPKAKPKAKSKPKSKPAEVTASSARVARMADRLFKWPVERRQLAVAAAKANLEGDHPRKRDAAIVATGLG